MSDRWNRIVNVAILATLAILLFNPSGVGGRWITGIYQGWQDDRRIERIWTVLSSAPSFLGSPPANASRVIVEFVDYDCAVCQSVAPAVSDAARTKGVSVVVRHVPSTRSGPAATEAALAAICAEEHGLFPAAHTELLSSRKWLNERDWAGFGMSLGIDEGMFANCMAEEAARERLAEDKALADSLEIRGTPTFVSAKQLHPGEPGLTVALAAAREAALSENSGFRPAEDHVPQRRLGRLSFDSSDLPNHPEYDVVGGLFLPDGGVALVGRAEIHIVDLVSGRTRTVGRRGEGPEEFRYISRVNRTLEGILVWDMPRRRASVVGHDGEFLRSRDYRQVPFQEYFNARPVAVHPDGRIIFRDGVDSGFGDYEGRVWNPAKYLAVEPEGELRLVSEAKGDELFYGPTRTSNVVFGHRTFEAATEDGLMIADTHRGAIAVLDWNGTEVAEISMPPGVQLTDAQTVGREFLARQSEELEERLNRAASAGQIPPGRAQSFRDALAAHDPETMAWPINEVLPAIDTLLADFDARLWARDYRLPGQDSVNWRVWDVAKAQPLFTVRMDGEDILLDAKGDLVLLRRLDVFDVPRAVVVRLVSGAD